jgi:hypothetical protein
MTLNRLSRINGTRIERELVQGPHAVGMAAERHQARTSALYDHGRQRVTVGLLCAHDSAYGRRVVDGRPKTQKRHIRRWSIVYYVKVSTEHGGAPHHLRGNPIKSA